MPQRTSPPTPLDYASPSPSPPLRVAINPEARRSLMIVLAIARRVTFTVGVGLVLSGVGHVIVPDGDAGSIIGSGGVLIGLTVPLGRRLAR